MSADRDMVWADGRRAWTDEEYGFILSPPRGWTHEDIAEHLGRTVATVKKYRRKLKGDWTREREAFTAEDLTYIADTMDRFASDVAADLGRTKASIQQARNKLRAKGVAGFSTAPFKRPVPHEVGARTLLAKTCPKCGLLWGGGEFTRMTRGYHPLCQRCLNRARRGRGTAKPRQPYIAAMEAVTRSFATISTPYRARGGEVWTGPDVDLLADRTLTTPQIAARLGRTWQAVQGALKRYDVQRPRETATRLPTGEWRIEFPDTELQAAS